MSTGTDKIIGAAADVAKSYAELARSVSVAMLDATTAQQQAQHAHMIETAEMCTRIIKGD